VALQELKASGQLIAEADRTRTNLRVKLRVASGVTVERKDNGESSHSRSFT
jgi:hypothetical protein